MDRVLIAIGVLLFEADAHEGLHIGAACGNGRPGRIRQGLQQRGGAIACHGTCRIALIVQDLGSDGVCLAERDDGRLRMIAVGDALLEELDSLVRVADRGTGVT